VGSSSRVPLRRRGLPISRRDSRPSRGVGHVFEMRRPGSTNAVAVAPARFSVAELRRWS